MAELKMCPCRDCEIKKFYARAFDMHWHDGEDCPFECPYWKEWKEWADT